MVVKKLYRFFLPLSDNAGIPFGDEDFLRVVDDMTEQFGGVSYLEPTPDAAWRGVWVDPLTGHVFRDIITIFFVIADPLPESDEFFTNYKENLKQRFRQEEILLTAHLVEVF